MKHTRHLDETAGNNKLEMANKLEQDQFLEYSTFHD